MEVANAALLSWPNTRAFYKCVPHHSLAPFEVKLTGSTPACAALLLFLQEQSTPTSAQQSLESKEEKKES